MSWAWRSHPRSGERARPLRLRGSLERWTGNFHRQFMGIEAAKNGDWAGENGDLNPLKNCGSPNKNGVWINTNWGLTEDFKQRQLGVIIWSLNIDVTHEFHRQIIEVNGKTCQWLKQLKVGSWSNKKLWRNQNNLGLSQDNLGFTGGKPAINGVYFIAQGDFPGDRQIKHGGYKPGIMGTYRDIHQ